MRIYWLIWFLKIFVSINKVNGEKPFVLKLERVDVKYVDESCIQNLTASVTKANRASPYVLNLSMNVLKPWFDNVTVSSTSYEFKNNQYKKSFIQMSNTACDLIVEGDQYLISLVRKYSNLPKKCPLPIGVFTLKGMVLVESYFPTGFPISKWRFNYVVKGTTSKISIMKIDLYFVAEPRLKLKAKNGKSKS